MSRLSRGAGDVNNSCVSVIIPCYNVREWIRETLDSVRIQGTDDIETIVVDDGSTDDSAEIVATEYPWVHLIRMANGGPSRARNIGWQSATGAWIQFLDSDDLLHREKIALQAKAAWDVGDDIAIVYSDWQRLGLVHDIWQPIGGIVSPVIGDDPLADLLKSENFIQIGSALVRRKWLEKVSGLNERHWLIEDVDLMLRIAMHGGKFHYIPTDVPLLYYRQHGGSLSRQNSRVFIEGCVRNAEMVETHWRAKCELSSERSCLLASIYFQGARYFAGADPQEFEALVQKIESLIPGFQPPGPVSLQRLARFLGYRRAERVAVWYRQLKRALSSS